nr:retrotransposon protein, putative, Ty1-copia subclass [Tanacetum cinerariifolium]
MSRQGASYFVTFTDDFSCYGYVYLLKHKHEVFETFKVFQKEVENQLGKTIKSLCSDRGGKYMSQEFLDHLKDHGIIAHRTPPYTPQHNGVSKRKNRALLDMVRSMMSQTTLPKSFWDYALETVARILNMVPTKKVEKTPYEVWHRKALKLSYLKSGVNSLIDQEASGSLEDLEIIQEDDTHPSLDTSLNHKEEDLEINEPQSDIVPIRRSTQTRHAPDRMCLYIDAEEHELGDLGEPTNYKAALLDPESKKWLNAMNVEIILIAIAAYYDYEIWQMDDKTAFLNGYLNEEYSNASKCKTYLGKCFAMKDIEKILKRYCMENSKRGSIHMQEKLKLSKSQGASTPAEMKRMQNVPYALTVGSIMVSCYTDAGYLTNAVDLKSQTGYVFILNGGAVDWKSAKQSIFATSSAKAEYIAAFDASKEAA